jgi:hypothetical protein
MPTQELSLGIKLAVLGAGLLHASWNAMLKSAPGGDPMLDTASVVAGSSVCALLLLPFIGVPAPAAWAFIAASSAIHFAYYITLAHAYRTGDLSFAYPLMRGTRAVARHRARYRLPARTPGARHCGHRADLRGHRQHRVRAPQPSSARRRRVGIREAGIIAVYTLIDGGGAACVGNAIAYVTWLIFLEGLPFLAGLRGDGAARNQLRVRAAGGAACWAAPVASPRYGIVLSRDPAPVAVAAPRVALFAALIGASGSRKASDRCGSPVLQASCWASRRSNSRLSAP